MTAEEMEQKQMEEAQKVAEEKITNAKAASEVVTVQAVPDKPKPAPPPPKPGTPLQPKSFTTATSSGGVQENEADKAIRQAETSQDPDAKDAITPENENQLEKQIAGSSGMWDSQLEMHQLTGKLTDPKQYRTSKEIAAENKLKEKQEKERIRNEILGAQPINDDDTRLFSGYLAGEAGKSKSDV